MSKTVPVGGVNHTLPSEGEAMSGSVWGVNLPRFFVAVAQQIATNPALITTVEVSTTPVAVAANQTYLVDSSVTAITLNLPEPSISTWFIVKDSGNYCATNNITFHRYGSESIEGTASDYTFAFNSAACMVFSDGTDWYLWGGTPPPVTTGQTISGGGANRILYEDGSQNLATNSGLTFDGSALTVPSLIASDLTASRVVISGADKSLDSSAVTSTELGYVSGVTSTIQTQIDTKAPTASPTFTGTATADGLTASTLVCGGVASTVGYTFPDGTVQETAADFTGVDIGDSVGSGTANRILYEDSSNQLAESENLTFDGSQLVNSGGVTTNALTSSFISSTSSSNLLISTPDESTASTKSLIIQTGDVTGVGAGNGGSISILAGDCGLAGASSGGDVTITAGAGHPASGVGGDVTISPGGGGELTLRGPANDVAYPGISVDRIVLTNGTVTFAKSATYDSSLEVVTEGYMTVNEGITTNALTATGLTSGRVPYITTGGRFTDSSNLLFDGTNLAVGGALSGGNLQTAGAIFTTASGAPNLIYGMTAPGITTSLLDVSATLVLPDGLTFNRASRDKEYSFTVDGGSGSLIATGAKKAYVRVSAEFVPAQWDIVTDQAGYIQFDIWKDSGPNFPPTVADSVVGSYKPNTSLTFSTSSTLTGWTTPWNKGDYLEINVDACTSITKAILTIVGTERSF